MAIFIGRRAAAGFTNKAQVSLTAGGGGDLSPPGAGWDGACGDAPVGSWVGTQHNQTKLTHNAPLLFFVCVFVSVFGVGWSGREVL